jgi:hypothetical protein
MNSKNYYKATAFNECNMMCMIYTYLFWKAVEKEDFESAMGFQFLYLEAHDNYGIVLESMTEKDWVVEDKMYWIIEGKPR